MALIGVGLVEAGLDGILKVGSTGDDNALEALAGRCVYSIKAVGMATLCPVTPAENGRRNDSRCLETRVSGAEKLSVQPRIP